MTDREEKRDTRKRCLLLIDEVVVTKIKMLALESGTTFSKYMENLAIKEIRDKNLSSLKKRTEKNLRRKVVVVKKEEAAEDD